MTTIIKQEEVEKELSVFDKIKSIKFPSFTKIGMAAVMIATTAHFANAYIQEKNEIDLELTPITEQSILMDIPSIPNQAENSLPPETPNWEFAKEEVKPIARLDFDSKTGSFVLLPVEEKLEQTIENAKNKELANETKNELDLSKDKVLSKVSSLRKESKTENKVVPKM